MNISKVFLLIAMSILSLSVCGQDSVEPKEEEDLVYKVVEQFPLFGGCDYSTMKTLAEKKACSDSKIIEFISSNISYPKKARRKGIEGVVYVQFVVGADGNVRDQKIVRDIGGGCGDIVLKMAKSFPKWVPGIQKGKPVSVLYTLPVTFKLPKDKQR